jgi:hypothetical protein
MAFGLLMLFVMGAKVTSLLLDVCQDAKMPSASRANRASIAQEAAPNNGQAAVHRPIEYRVSHGGNELRAPDA